MFQTSAPPGLSFPTPGHSDDIFVTKFPGRPRSDLAQKKSPKTWRQVAASSWGSSWDSTYHSLCSHILCHNLFHPTWPQTETLVFAKVRVVGWCWGKWLTPAQTNSFYRYHFFQDAQSFGTKGDLVETNKNKKPMTHIWRSGTGAVARIEWLSMT